MGTLRDFDRGDAKLCGRFIADSLIGGGAAVSIGDAGPVNYTAAQILAGLILRDCNGAPRTDVMPAAADLVAALGYAGICPNASVANALEFTIRNDSGAANAITVDTPGAAVVLSGTMIIVQGASRRFRVEFTNVTAGTEAVKVYGL
jgi:hypothetical protein